MRLFLRFKNLKTFTILVAVVLAAAFWGSAETRAQQAQTTSVSGVLVVIHDQTSDQYFVIDQQNTRHRTQVFIDDRIAAPLGGIEGLLNKSVTVSGTPTRASGQGTNSSAPPLLAQTITVNAVTRAAGVSAAPPTGATPWVTLLCMFSDQTVQPHPPSWYNTLMLGSYPSLDDYYRESSYNTINLMGSTVVSHWYSLPSPLASYKDAQGNFLYMQALDDCTAAAAPDVNFPSFYGITMQFNGDPLTTALGGQMYLTLNGVTRTWGSAWFSRTYGEYQTVWAHEMGHGYGLFHSGNAIGGEYADKWDVMGYGYQRAPAGVLYSYLAQHTLARNKDWLGWIPAAQKYTYGGSGQVTLTLEQLAQPQTSNYRLVQIPIGGSSTHFYTVEARLKVGNYDGLLPTNAVLIHEVLTTRSVPAYAVGDSSAAADTATAAYEWEPGETFSDATNHVTITVLATTATGFAISITNSTVTVCTGASLSASPSGQAAVGTSLTLTGGATGCPNPRYRFWQYSGPQNLWTMLQDYGTSATAPVPTTGYTGGSYTFAVTVRDQSSTAERDKDAYLAYTLTGQAPCATAGLTISPATQAAVGTALTLTGSNTGCSGTPQYRFWQFKAATSQWSMLQDYGSGAVLNLSTTGYAPGSYTFAVTVRSGGSTAEREADVYVGYSLTGVSTGPCTAAGLAIAPANAATVGTTLTLTASSGGCGGTPQYRIWQYVGATSTWSMLRDYGTGTSLTVPTTGYTAGAYTFAVTARSGGSTAEREAAVYVGYTLNAAGSVTCASAGLTISPAAQATAGTTLTLTASSTGCSGTPQYRYWQYVAATSTWTVLQDYTTSTSLQVPTTGYAAGSFTFAVTARGQGSTAEREAAVYVGYTLN